MNFPNTSLTLPAIPKLGEEYPLEPEGPFWSRTDRSGECWIWTGARFTTGYGAVWDRKRARRAHRVAWELTRGPIPTGGIILHTCDVPACIRPDHLRLGTMRDNTRDMDAKGRRGRHPRAKLTIEKVREIRRLRRSGLTLKELGERFGVTWVAIHLVVTRKTWASVPEEAAS